MKILIRGGSIAAGHGVKKGYADILKAHFAKKGVAVINRSRFGETSFDGINTFDRDIDVFQPEMLVVHFGIDDAFGGVYRSEFQENMVRMVRRARDHFNPVVFLATSHPFDHPPDKEAVDIFYRSLSIVAMDLRCVLIPVHLHWWAWLMRRDVRPQSLLQSDTRYPNEQGHRIIAQAMAASLNKFL